MSEQQNNNPQNESTKNAQAIEAETVEAETAGTNQNQAADSTADTITSHFNSEVLTKILVTLLFVLIGWVSLWVFGVVVLVQFGFLLITGALNKNLKAFNGELGEYLSDIIAYVGFQKDEKPFPFQSWHYDDDKTSENGEPAQ